MKYAHIVKAILGSRWAIEENYLRAMIDIVDRKLRSVRLSAAEIEAKIGPAKERKIAEQAGGVLVLPLVGAIMNRAYMLEDVSTERGTSTEILSRQFNQALNDPNIKAIVLDVNSPGGSVSGVEELSAEIFAARGVKPVIAQVNAFAASAAYWIASAAEEIVVTPTSEVGSIGVWSLHVDWSKNLEMDGLQPTLIHAGKYKVEGNPYEPLDEEATRAIQEDVDAYYDMFVKAVARNRGVDVKEIKSGFGEGRMVRATEAVKLGMADRIGTMRDTLSRLGVGGRAPAAKNGRAAQHAAHRRREIEILNLKNPKK